MSTALPKLALPRDWPKSVKSAYVCAVAFARMARIAPANRPHYPPTERLAILALKAARGWNNAQTARAFLLTDMTIASWLKRIDESGSDALVRLPEPVNRFPDFVRQVVQQLKCVCPTMGKVRIAQMLARAGLRLSPLRLDAFQSELASYFRWYNDVRPHQSLGGRTPNEVYLGVPSARDAPRFEPKQRTLISNRCRKRGRKFVPTNGLTLLIDYLDNRRHSPIVSLKRAA
jgi:hypothetical protein